MSSGITLTLRLGTFGEREQQVVLKLPDDIARALTEPMELSDESLSQLLASPGLYGGHGDCVTVRKKKFALRRDQARVIAREIERELFKLFGVDDHVNGYRRPDWSERDQQTADHTYRTDTGETNHG